MQANNVLITLSQIYAKAQDWGIVAEGTNPCRHVELYRQRKRYHGDMNTARENMAVAA